MVARTNQQSSQARKLPDSDKLQDDISSDLRGSTPRNKNVLKAIAGKIPISHELTDRPVAANNRERLGDWEADTIVGFNRKSGLLTLVCRKSRFLICEKLTRLGSKEMEEAMIEVLGGQPVHSITPDRGREFQLHGKVTAALGVEFYFPPPHQLNHRPRKCLGYRPPAEVYFSTMLHLT